MKRLTPRERRELDDLLVEGVKPENTQSVDASNRFVSRFGNNKRVLWEKSGSGDVVVLTVLAA